MLSKLAMPVSLVLITSLGCASSSPSRPTAATPSNYAARVASDPWSLLKAGASTASFGVKASAVINGFRVHPDPQDDGVIRVVEGENVVVNATDIATPQSFLVVKWGDDDRNQRVGCGPCRMDHGYAPGRYTLVASLDGAPGDRSISVPVEVSSGHKQERSSRFEFFGFTPNRLSVGEPGVISIPLVGPPGVDLVDLFVECEPDPFPITPVGAPAFFPTHVELPFVAATPSVCTLYLYGDDATTGAFTEISQLTIQ